MRVIISLILCVVLSSCVSSRLSQGSDTTYITKIEYKEILKDTTVFVPIIKEKIINATRDTSSRIETSYAVSVANVECGTLYHTIENKPHIVPIKVHYKDIARTESTESIISNTIIKEVERDFYWWEEAFMFLGKIMLVLLVVAMGFILIKKGIG